MNNQQAFDKVWEHFVVNKRERSVNSLGNCVYRGPNGTKCAVGVLFPDELYSPSMDEISGNGVSYLIGENLKVAEFFKDTDTRFLMELQQRHDDYSYWKDGHLRPDALLNMVKDWDLKVPVN